MWSAPARELWIEIVVSIRKHAIASSAPARELWIEMVFPHPTTNIATKSAPARELWIEIIARDSSAFSASVSSCEGAVD